MPNYISTIYFTILSQIVNYHFPTAILLTGYNPERLTEYPSKGRSERRSFGHNLALALQGLTLRG